MTVGELISRLQRTVGFPLTDEQALDYLNDIQRRICQSGNYYFMETDALIVTVKSIPSYPLPNDFKDERSVVLFQDGEEKPLKPISPHYFASVSEKEGVPQFYRYDAEATITFLPVPDDRYNILIRYYRFLPDMTLDDLDKSPFLVRVFPEVLLTGAKARALEDIGELNLASQFWQHYQALMVQLFNQHMEREFPSDFSLIPANSPFGDVNWR